MFIEFKLREMGAWTFVSIFVYKVSCMFIETVKQKVFWMCG